MNREKSKELYAKTIFAALRDLDDDLIAEAHEEEKNSIPSVLFRTWQYVPRAAASFLLIGVLVLIVLLATRTGHILPLVSDGAADPQASFAISRGSEIQVQWMPEEDAADRGTLTFTGLDGAEILYFTFAPTTKGGQPSVLYNGETPKLVEIDGAVYYQIPVKGLDRVSISLSGVSDPSDIQIRIMVGKEETVIRPSA